jgi:biotin carboxyl carrier protein
MVMEAMKMEHKILAPSGGEVSSVHYKEGDRVDMGSVLIEMDD